MVETFQILFILFLGLCLGSFASLLAYRVPRGLPWAAARSQCPACNHVLGALDLLPVLSWILSKGKCRHCSIKIPARYVWLELISAAVCLGLYGMIGWHWPLLPALMIVPFTLAWATMRLSPDA